MSIKRNGKHQRPVSLCPGHSWLSCVSLRKLFFRLLTWRPAGAEGDHMATQALSDKQLVGKHSTLFILVLACVLLFLTFIFSLRFKIFVLLLSLPFPFLMHNVCGSTVFVTLPMLPSGLHFPEVSGYPHAL